MAENKNISLGGHDPKKGRALDLWFHDSVELGYGSSLHIQIKNVLYRSRSEYQEIVIVETAKMGRMLVIDGVIMLTEFDEHAYHEMISHVPLLIHPKPSRVLIIGGGDGGALREVLKHPEVNRVHVCEIDREVIEACQQFLPSIASGYADPRVEVFYEDGARFVAKYRDAYDIIMVDSTDPFGPGQILFQEGFYTDLKKALSEDGIAVTQCESIYLHGHVIKGVYSFAQRLFPRLGYYYTLVPTYPSGLIGFYFCSLKYPPQEMDEKRAARLAALRYYTPDIHRSAFALPRFASEYFK
jgi:spermidine synthase